MAFAICNKFLLALVVTTRENLDQTFLTQNTLVQLMRKAATVTDWQNAHEIGRGPTYLHANQTRLPPVFEVRQRRETSEHNKEETSAETLLNG